MARNEQVAVALDMRGLDMVTPVDLIKDGRTPFSKNFRLYAQQSDDRRVAVSSRKGPGFYINPLVETLSDANTASTGASTAKVGVISGLHAQPVTAASTGRIERIDIKIANVDQANAPVMVRIYSDKAGKPDKLLSESSLANGNISGTAAYVSARFIKAPLITSGTAYWIVLQMQDDGQNVYTLSTTTAGVDAYTSDTSLSALTQQTYGINYRVYVGADQADKGAYRFNRDNGVNTTLVCYGTTMYRVDEASHNLIKIVDGLNVNATEYNFTNGDNKVFWVNSYDQLTAWDGTDENTASNLVANGSFTTNTTGWAATAGTTLSRVTSDFNSTPASMQLTAASGIRGGALSISLNSNTRYKISYYVKGSTATGNTYLTLNGGTTALVGTTNPVTTAWVKREFYYTPGVDVTTLEFKSASDNVFIDDVTVTPTGIEYIIDTELPILSDVIFHKDRIWGRVAADPNKLVFSENPGNPSNNAVRAQWYYQWLSVSFIYVPRPHNGSPITAFVSFQDALTVFTQDKKYVITGYDRGSFNLRESTGSKGALSKRGVAADENKIYFVSNDGLYEHNGSSDVKISALINPLFDGCGQKENISPVIWKSHVRFYMASQGSTVNDTCIIYDKDLKEMVYDTDTYVNRALYYGDADDEQQLIEFSSLYASAFNAEADYNSLGAPIDFEYRLKYDSMGMPANKKRLRRYFPILQGVDKTFSIQLAMDKDFQDSPRVKDVLMTVNGALLGQFKFGDGTLLGGDKSFKQHRQSYSGYAYYWQLRVMRYGVNNRVAFIGAQYSYKTKRL